MQDCIPIFSSKDFTFSTHRKPAELGDVRLAKLKDDIGPKDEKLKYIAFEEDGAVRLLMRNDVGLYYPAVGMERSSRIRLFVDIR